MTSDEQQRVWSTEHWADAEPSAPALDAALMRLLLDNISTRVAVVGRDRCYRYANRETLKFMGLPAGQVIGRHMSQVLDTGVFETISPLFDRAFAGEQLRRSAWADYAKQGRRFREQWYVPYRPHGIGGDVEAVVVCGLDHTEQRLSEQQLADERARLRTSEALKAAIVDHALTAFVSTDADGRIVEFNPSAEAMFGRSRASVLGLRVSDVMIPQRFRDAHERGMQRMRQGHASTVFGRRLEMHAIRSDGDGGNGSHATGTEFPMEMVLWRTDVDGAAFYTASISDLSERHAAAQQIERQREALRQSEKLTAMGSLLAGVSHELNNPLAIVMGRASLLEEKCEGNPALQHDALRIREAAERCGRIVRTFLNMARNRPLRRTAIDLADAVRASTDMLGYTYRSHDIALRTAIDPALPRVDADVDQICQIVLNLLVNAQQALLLPVARGPRHVSIEAGSVDGGRTVWLRVADNGPGVAKPLQARLFEPFFTTKGEGLGTGMGLAVSRTLARAHGGDLVLEDAGGDGGGVGNGAAFRLTLPAVVPAADAAAAWGAAEGTPSAEPSAATTTTRILVVDDEADLANVLREMLESAGHEVASAESGAVALQLLQGGRFDAVVSDLRMSDMDGAGLWRAIAASHPQLLRSLLFITGDTLSADAAAFFAASGCACLEKPFTKEQLLRTLGGLAAPAAPAADPQEG